ncbi:MAG: uncharacterized protein KVP18_000978 [Porospora cf. gigantea A]|uniref:uncharacterized protein n=1 Tax=Porospora cf. gigantea A TaxID=2853593 RepID=UPI00355A4C0C|nr:MAG: hypothetical protein KVP18_000978 [Porospora cf. gigantea A]
MHLHHWLLLVSAFGGLHYRDSALAVTVDDGPFRRRRQKGLPAGSKPAYLIKIPKDTKYGAREIYSASGYQQTLRAVLNVASQGFKASVSSPDQSVWTPDDLTADAEVQQPHVAEVKFTINNGRPVAIAALRTRKHRQRVAKGEILIGALHAAVGYALVSEISRRATNPDSEYVRFMLGRDGPSKPKPLINPTLTLFGFARNSKHEIRFTAREILDEVLGMKFNQPSGGPMAVAEVERVTVLNGVGDRGFKRIAAALKRSGCLTDDREGYWSSLPGLLAQTLVDGVLQCLEQRAMASTYVGESEKDHYDSSWADTVYQGPSPAYSNPHYPPLVYPHPKQTTTTPPQPVHPRQPQYHYVPKPVKTAHEMAVGPDHPQTDNVTGKTLYV